MSFEIQRINEGIKQTHRAIFRSFFRRRSCIRLDSVNIIKKSNMQTKPRARLGILRAALLHIIFKFRKCETPNYFR